MSANYKTVQRDVKALQFTGSNFDALSGFVGEANFMCDGGNVKVFGTPVPTGQYTVLDRDDDSFIEVVDASTFGATYVADTPPNYKTTARNVKAEQYTGSNKDAIAAFVTPANFSFMRSVVRVYDKTPLPVNEYVILDRGDDSFIEVADSSRLSTEYAPDAGP
jgi:hypothetical protein